MANIYICEHRVHIYTEARRQCPTPGNKHGYFNNLWELKMLTHFNVLPMCARACSTVWQLMNGLSRVDSRAPLGCYSVRHLSSQALCWTNGVVVYKYNSHKLIYLPFIRFSIFCNLLRWQLCTLRTFSIRFLMRSIDSSSVRLASE
jgi:hypothetical protein